MRGSIDDLGIHRDTPAGNLNGRFRLYNGNTRASSFSITYITHRLPLAANCRRIAGHSNRPNSFTQRFRKVSDQEFEL